MKKLLKRLERFLLIIFVPESIVLEDTIQKLKNGEL